MRNDLNFDRGVTLAEVVEDIAHNLDPEAFEAPVDPAKIARQDVCYQRIWLALQDYGAPTAIVPGPTQ